MRAVRRFYFYLVTLISLEVIVWGVISLARTLVSEPQAGTAANLLASGLALVLVGIPIFLIHWLAAQRDVRRDEEERSTALRALFLYGVRLATLTPVVYALLAMVNRAVIQSFGFSPLRALIGGGQTFWDNFIAIVVNLVAWLYFERVLAGDWQTSGVKDPLRDTRRLYRYVWVLYSLVLTVGGMQQVLDYLFLLPGSAGSASFEVLANGVALVLVGAPLWAYTGTVARGALLQPGERPSWLRLAVLYLLTFIGLATSLAAIGNAFAAVLRWILGEAQTLGDYLSTAGLYFSLAVPFGVMWAYYYRELFTEIDSELDALRHDSFKRFFRHVLALLGFGAVFFGCWRVSATLVDFWLGGVMAGAGLRAPLSVGLAALAVGLPLWLRPWLAVQEEALCQGQAGDHARRSVVRKGYLYLLVFALVIGAMVSAGSSLYLAFSQLLGNPTENFAWEFGQRVQIFLLVMVWLVYYYRVLRGDARRAHEALAERHAAFQVLAIYSGSSRFVEELHLALHRQAPRMPLVVRRLDEELSEDLLSSAVVVLPLPLILHPSEKLRSWLGDFKGERVLVPSPSTEVIWLGQPQTKETVTAGQAAQVICQLAEGQAVRVPAPVSTWTVVGYVLAGLFALQLSFVLLSLIISMLQ